MFLVTHTKIRNGSDPPSSFCPLFRLPSGS